MRVKPSMQASNSPGEPGANRVARRPSGSRAASNVGARAGGEAVLIQVLWSQMIHSGRTDKCRVDAPVILNLMTPKHRP